MKKQFIITEDILFDYIDGNLSIDEARMVEQYCNTHKEWNNKLLEFKKVNTLLSHSEIQTPSLSFTSRVMQDVATVKMISESWRKRNTIIGSIMLALALATIITALILPVSGNLHETIEGISLSWKNYSVNIPGVSLPVTPLINVSIIILLIISLILFDRVILHPFFQKRKKSSY